MGADATLVVFADGAENHQKELQELRAAAQTVVESVGSVTNLKAVWLIGFRRFLKSLPSTWRRLLGIVWRRPLVLSSHTGLGPK